MELFAYDKQQQLPTAIFICNYLLSSQSKKSTIYGCREINEPNQL